jgi:UDP-2,3-diacylglucosamine pyrophosphatase LpxH
LRTIVLADLHLTRHTPEAVVDALVGLVEAHRGARLVFAGDLFDLSAEHPSSRPASLLEALDAQPRVRAALGEHLDRQGALWMVAGNHDAEVGTKAFEDGLFDALGSRKDTRDSLRTTPWFFREGGLHIEHGHLYDPDNAPAHPLSHEGTSLGVRFVEQFIAPTGAHAYLNANDRKPLELFLSSFKWYGPRAPYVIYRFFYTAFSSLLVSGARFPSASQLKSGEGRIDDFVQASGMTRFDVDALLPLAATPTLASTRATFARLYLDRVAATVAIGGGMTALAFGATWVGGGALALGALAMGTSWSRGKDRYAGRVRERLEDSALAVGKTTGASLVVFGHTHHEALQSGYANTGSFSFPGAAPGRPYLEIEGSSEAPRAVRRYHR